MLPYYDKIEEQVLAGISFAQEVIGALEKYERRLRELRAINSGHENITLKHDGIDITVKRREFEKIVQSQVEEAKAALKKFGLNV